MARLSLHLSKYHIVGNHMPWLICLIHTIPKFGICLAIIL